MSPLPIVLGVFAYNGALVYSTLNYLPTTLLRLLPIVSSTASLIWAWDEHTTFSAWMDPSYRTEADKLLPSWYQNWEKRGIAVLLTSFPLSLSAGLANVISLAPAAFSLRDSPRTWYALGTVFALAHMFFGSVALELLAEIQLKGKKTGADGKRPTSTDAMGRWLRMHALRTPTTDLPAVLCFLTGTYLGLAPV